MRRFTRFVKIQMLFTSTSSCTRTIAAAFASIYSLNATGAGKRGCGVLIHVTSPARSGVQTIAITCGPRTFGGTGRAAMCWTNTTPLLERVVLTRVIAKSSSNNCVNHLSRYSQGDSDEHSGTNEHDIQQ